MIDVSVIVPIYNGEKYLSQSLDGIINQTLTNIEIICIDDASDDSTRIILEQYAEKDLRIKIITNKERYGAAISRNKGINIAKGKYLIFLDADDLFENNLLEILHKNIVKHDVQIMQISYDSFYGNMYGSEYKIDVVNLPKKYLNKVITIKDIVPVDFLYWNLSPWNKMYLKDYIIKEKILFQNLQCCNDVYFTFLTVLLADKMMHIETELPLIHYRQHNLTSRISYNRELICIYHAYREIQIESIKRNKWEDFIEHFLLRALHSFCLEINNCKDSKQKQKFYYYLQNDGISEICKRGNINIDMLNPYIQKILYNFLYLSYSTLWFEKIVKLDYYLETNSLRLINLFNEARTEGKKIGLWGAGKNGYAILNFCNDNNLEVFAVIDKDKEKQGTNLLNKKISDFYDVMIDIDIIIVSSSNIYNDINQIIILNNCNIVLIDIQQYLNMII